MASREGLEPHQEFLHEHLNRDFYLQLALSAGLTAGELDRLDMAILENHRAMQREDDEPRKAAAQMELGRAVKPLELGFVVREHVINIQTE